MSIYEAALNTPFIPEEDVFFTGVVANHLLNIDIIHDNSFSDSRPMSTNYCAFKKLITAHHLKPKDLTYLWYNRKTCNSSTTEWIQKFFNYLSL